MAETFMSRAGTYPSDAHVEHASFSHPFISWRSIIAGLLVAFLVDATLMALGLAIGGVSLSGGIEASAASAGLMTGAWFLISAIVSLFAGGYFAARVSNFSTPMIGSAQGLVIAGLFFALFLWQATEVVGWATRLAGSAVATTTAAASGGAAALSQSEIARTAIDDAVGDLELRSSPETVISGVATRLIRGDAQSAKVYLARQANISPAEADRRINEANAQVAAAGRQVREGAAKALQATGWSLFVGMLLGAAAAIGGGAVGSRLNERKPLAIEHGLVSRDMSMSPV